MTIPDDTALAAAKRALRMSLRRALTTLPAHVRVDGGAAVVEPVLAFLERCPGPVALFSSLPWEIATAPLDVALRRAGRARALPSVGGAGELVFRLIPDEVAAAALPRDGFGVPSPPPDFAAVDARALGALVVPGVGFDDDGGRIGYGKGYYDRVLGRCGVERAVGLLLDVQRVPRVPRGAHDVRLRYTCQPSRGLVDHGA